ncbi:MAG: pyruvate ferredoxin oxidoreductase [Candidatus Aminicenantes bacterium]|nr:MAG: pyruvate ferredoxin oxidoreductase [Candidatus Aminicenantes bacterium]
MMPRMMLDGNGASTEAIRLARVGVISAYPITPQSPIAEKLSQYVADGRLEAKYLRVESEHTALSCAIGSMLTGVRAATATSSVGLALMHEILGVASGLRIPVVMPLINRALVAPWSLWCDHQDSMAERDSGWIQLYAENVQEVLDLLLIAYKAAEHEQVLLPAMVCFDGFFLSHSIQPVEVPDQDAVDHFLPKYECKNLYLDPDDPMFVNDLTSPDEFSEMRYQQMIAFKNALEIIPGVQDEFFQLSGRRYQMIETYKCEDADVVLVTIGSMAGTAKHVVNQLRTRGEKIGIVKITCFRPFPVEIMRGVLKGKKVIGIIDRSAGLGAEGGPVWLEVKSVAGKEAKIFDYIAGLGGRDIPETTIEKICIELLQSVNKEVSAPKKPWIDTAENAMDIREARVKAHGAERRAQSARYRSNITGKQEKQERG